MAISHLKSEMKERAPRGEDRGDRGDRGDRTRSAKTESAGGQLLQPSEVKSSTTATPLAVSPPYSSALASGMKLDPEWQAKSVMSDNSDNTHLRAFIVLPVRSPRRVRYYREG